MNLFNLSVVFMVSTDVHMSVGVLSSKTADLFHGPTAPQHLRHSVPRSRGLHGSSLTPCRQDGVRTACRRTIIH